MPNRFVHRGLVLVTCAALYSALSLTPAANGQTAPTQEAPPKKKLTFPPVDSSKMPRLVRTRFEELRRMLDNEPADLERVVRAASMLFVHGAPKDAVAFLEKSLELSDTEPAIHHLLGIFHEKAGDPAKAAAQYQRAIDLEPQFSPPYMRKALLVIDKDPATAKKLLEASLASEPNDPRALCALGRCLAAAGDKSGAIDAQRRALALFPPYKEAHERLAALLAEEGKVEEAAAHRKVAESGSEAPYADFVFFSALEFGLDVPTLIQVANRYGSAGDVQNAEALLTQAIEIEGVGTSAREAMALLKFRSGKHNDAISMLNSIVTSEPKAAAPRAQLGEVFYRSGRNKEALEAFKKAAELAPKEGRYQYWIALVNFREKNLDAALEAFAKASELSPQLLEARVGYAQLASQKKQYDVAAKAFAEALRDNPESPLIQNAAAWFFATIPSDAHRNAKEAVRLAEAACKAVSDGQHEYLDTLAAAYANDGRFEEAVSRTKDAIAKVDAAITAATDDPTRERLKGLKMEYESRLKLYGEKKPYREESR